MYFHKPHFIGKENFPWTCLNNNYGIFHIYIYDIRISLYNFEQSNAFSKSYKYIIRKLVFNKKNGLEINLPAFYQDILLFIVILLVSYTFDTFPMRLLLLNSIIVRC